MEISWPVRSDGQGGKWTGGDLNPYVLPRRNLKPPLATTDAADCSAEPPLPRARLRLPGAKGEQRRADGAPDVSSRAFSPTDEIAVSLAEDLSVERLEKIAADLLELVRRKQQAS